MPITKHNVVVTKAEDVARTLREAFLIANSGRPALSLSTSPKTRNKLPPNSTGKRLRQNFRPSAGATNHDQAEFDRAVRCSTPPSAPSFSPAMASWFPARCAPLSNSSAPQLSCRHDPPRIGCFPAIIPQPRMMGMHGEAWVNNAIQEPTFSLPSGCVLTTASPRPAHLCKSARKIHIEIDRAEINKNVKVDAALVGDARECSKDSCPTSRPAITAPGFGMSPN